MNIRKIIVRSIMFISSYAPLYVFLLILQYEDIKKSAWSSLSIMFLLVMIFFISVSAFSLICIRNSIVGNAYRIMNVKRPNGSVITYVFTYIVPILSISIKNVPNLIVNLLLFILVWFLYIRLNLVFMNPLWALFGYITYEDQDNYIITDIPFEQLSKTNCSLKGSYLVNDVFLAKKKDNLII
nr:MAG TPA: hypothetical protein [Caudoviricetes sp.]